MGLYGVKNEFGGAKSGVLDPVNPQGPELEDQGPWKLGVTNFFFACIQIAFALAFISALTIVFGPQLTPLDPKKPKNNQNQCGGSLSDPSLLASVG